MRRREDMTFAPEEYERRVRELRERMAQRELDAVIITDPENLMYLTDHQTTGYSFFQALVLPLEAEPVMITRALEESNVVARTWLEHSRAYPDSGDAILELVSTLRDLRLDEARVGYERNSYYFPAYQQDRFHDAFGEGLVDCFGIVEEGRLRKSPAEIEVMQLAAYAAVVPYVASGPRSMIGHSTWEGRMIRPGEHVFLEVGGCYRRYHAALMRTVVNGALSPSMHAAQELMKHTLAELRALMRPGVTVSEVDRLTRELIESNDVGASLATRAGYSIGIAFPPSWDEGYILSLLEGDERPLEEGMTFHLIPWMWGVDGDKTVGISDTVRITADGCASFLTLPEDFTVHESSARTQVMPVLGGTRP
jgi:Xaa-Pro dipeptidase